MEPTVGPWPLAGVRVVDLSDEISGGYCSKLLTDAGADVVKLEPAAGDPLRRWVASGTPLAAGADAPLFQFLHASQRSVVVDAATEPDTVAAWIAAADIVLATTALDAAAVLAQHPRLVVVTITPWGATGPWRDRPATEFTVQAASGTTFTRGLPEREPLSVGGRHGEWNVATFAAMGAITAWLHVLDTGQGQHVDVSMFEALHSTMNSPYAALAAQWSPDVVIGRTIEVPSIEPAADGWVGFCTQTGQQWKDFCSLVEHPEMGDDPRFVNNNARMPHRLEIAEVVHAYTRPRTVDEVCEIAELFRVPATPVGNGRSVLEMVHFQERGVFVPSPHGFTQPRVPYLVDGVPARPFTEAPALGAHQHATPWADRPRAPRAPGRRKPFEGLRVLDISAFWAGPFASTWLGALGADVVRIESVRRPDMMRFGATPFFGEGAWEWSAVTSGTNSSKRAITLDLDREPGASLVRRLVDWADVIVENMAPRVFDQFELGWPHIEARNPRAILLRMPAFGLDGPWRDRTGWAMTVEQTTGLAWTTGYDDIPVVPRGACDPLGALHALIALVAALEQRERTGAGCLVEVALVESAFNIAAEQVIEWTAHGALLRTEVNRGPFAAPQGLYESAEHDRYVAVAVATDAQWAALCALLADRAFHPDAGADGLDPRWSLAERRARHDTIDAVLGRVAHHHAPAELEARLLAAGVPASMVVNPKHLLDNPQMVHRGFLQEMQHPIHGACRYPVYPVQFSAFGPALHRCPPPTFGQHNDEVLHEVLGCTPEEIAALRAGGHIGERPAFV